MVTEVRISSGEGFLGSDLGFLVDFSGWMTFCPPYCCWIELRDCWEVVADVVVLEKDVEERA